MRFFVSGNFHGNLVVGGEKYSAAGEKKSGLYAEISYCRAPAFLIRIAICAPLYFHRRGALTSVVHGVSAAKARGRQGTWVCKYSLSRSLALVWLLAGAAHNLECMQASHTWVLVRGGGVLAASLPPSVVLSEELGTVRGGVVVCVRLTAVGVRGRVLIRSVGSPSAAQSSKQLARRVHEDPGS